MVWIEHSRLIFLLGKRWQIWSLIAQEGISCGVWKMSDLSNVSSISEIFVVISLLWGPPSRAVQVVGAQGHHPSPTGTATESPLQLEVAVGPGQTVFS